MRTSGLRKVVAVALVLTTTFITTPLSAADFTTKNALGSVSAIGNVQLRGISISQEGTLFAGDNIRAGDKAYAKVLLQNGNKIEVGEKTEMTVGQSAIALVAGNVGFTAFGKEAVRIAFQPFEMVASDAAGNISVNAGTAAGVRAVSGKVTIRNTKTSESFVLTKGQERWFGLKDGTAAKPIAEIASSLPDALPLPQTPAGQTGGGMAMDAGAWAAVIAAGAVTGLAIWGLVVALDNQDDIDALTSRMDTLSGQITTLQGTVTTNQATVNAQLAALARAQAISESAFNARLNALAITNTASQVSVAAQTAPNLSPTERSTFTARAQTLASQALGATQRILSIQAQIDAIEAQLQQPGLTQAQVTALNTQLTALRNQLATEITGLNTIRASETQLIADISAAGVTGISSGSQTTPEPPSASILQ